MIKIELRQKYYNNQKRSGERSNQRTTIRVKEKSNESAIFYGNLPFMAHIR
jgi:hypothetical protein